MSTFADSSELPLLLFVALALLLSARPVPPSLPDFFNIAFPTFGTYYRRWLLGQGSSLRRLAERRTVVARLWDLPKRLVSLHRPSRGIALVTLPVLALLLHFGGIAVAARFGGGYKVDTLWQVQATVSTVGLSLLLIFFELVKDGPDALAPITAVLLERSKAYGIAIVCLAITLTLGLADQQNRLWAHGLLVATIVLVAVGYSLTLSLVSSPHIREQEEDDKVVRDFTAAFGDWRLAKELSSLFDALVEPHLEGQLLWERPPQQSTFAVRASQSGLIYDINPIALRQLLSVLATEGAEATSSRDSARVEGSRHSRVPSSRLRWMARPEATVVAGVSPIAIVDTTGLSSNDVQLISELARKVFTIAGGRS